jgi:hypothetical protein
MRPLRPHVGGAMEEDEEDAHALGLLVDLRNLCLKLAERHDQDAVDLHRLLQQIQNPSLHGLDHQLSGRLKELGPGYYGETLRTVSANSDLMLAHAGFDAAVKRYPGRRWMPTWHGRVAAKHEPPGMDVES